ncbi:MAG: ketopantoate reductase family protein [Candidatus Hodarchaeota archaeon]
MRVVVMGSGAIGSLYGGLLSLAGEDVVLLVGRPRNVDSINERGLRIKGILGEHTLILHATLDAEEIEEADLVLVTTKTYDSVEAAKRIQHMVDKGAYVMVLQNGIGTEKLVAEVLGSTRVLRATTCMGAIMTSPGEVTATGCGVTEIGSHFPENQDMVNEVAAMFERAGFEVKTSENIEGVVWTKTIVNCGINPIGALTGFTNGEIYNDPLLRQLVVRLVEEAAEVAEALGVELTTDDPIRYTLGTAKATGDNINSMLQDIRACKQTEIDAITGEVIRLAQDLDIETPFSESIYALVKAVEAKRLKKRVEPDVPETLSPEEIEKLISNV